MFVLYITTKYFQNKEYSKKTSQSFFKTLIFELLQAKALFVKEKFKCHMSDLKLIMCPSELQNMGKKKPNENIRSTTENRRP